MTDKTARRSVDFTALPRSQRLRGKRRPPRVGDRVRVARLAAAPHSNAAGQSASAPRGAVTSRCARTAFSFNPRELRAALGDLSVSCPANPRPRELECARLLQKRSRKLHSR